MSAFANGAEKNLSEIIELNSLSVAMYQRGAFKGAKVAVVDAISRLNDIARNPKRSHIVDPKIAMDECYRCHKTQEHSVYTVTPFHEDNDALKQETYVGMFLLSAEYMPLSVGTAGAVLLYNLALLVHRDLSTSENETDMKKVFHLYRNAMRSMNEIPEHVLDQSLPLLTLAAAIYHNLRIISEFFFELEYASTAKNILRSLLEKMEKHLEASVNADTHFFRIGLMFSHMNGKSIAPAA